MTTGQRIKAMRKNAGMTQAELAEMLGIPYQSISQWERDTRNPKYESLVKIADAIGVKWYDLVPPEESTRMIVEHTNDVISQEENQGKSFVKTWPPPSSFPSDSDKHMAELADSYYHGVIHWAEDKLFTEAQTITIKMHVSELLLRYRQVIERTLSAKLLIRSLANIQREELPHALIQQHLADDLEKELNNLKAWIDTIPFYFSASLSQNASQLENSTHSEE